MTASERDSTIDQEHDDPATDPRANYDYSGKSVERPALVSDLEGLVDGEVRFDEYTRQLYATDASAYEVTPVGVVFPHDTADVSATVEYCAERKVPVLPRGGGTSLAGQAVNEAVVLDLARHMDGVIEIDSDARRARVQAGAVLADVNADLEPFGLKFAPDPAAGNRSVIGGAIGNNSTGAHSLKYGKTDAYVESCEVVLADGTVATFGEVTLTELRERADPTGDLRGRIHAEIARIVDEDAEAVEEAYPAMKRNVSGYNLNVLIEEAAEGSVNLARLLAGSEGTLAVVTEAEVSLEPVPETTSLAFLTYRSVDAAMEDMPHVLEHDASAVELIDDVLLDLARDTAEFAEVAGMLPDGTEAALLVEFYAETNAEGEQKVADLIDDRISKAGSGEYNTSAFAALEAHNDADRASFWKLRKAAMPILLGRTSDAKHISFIEDCAVPPEHLTEYVQSFREILAEHDTFASFYGHAGPGVLHVRPLINTKEPLEVEAMESIADAVTDLIVEYGGSVSGEHGDGRARTQWNRKLYGDGLWETFRSLKTAFDPDWLFNPGHVCGDVDMTENLRFDPDYEFDAGFDPVLEWDNENGFRGMAELCHGCGGCRGKQDTTGGMMCPTYRAANEEVLSTRGRANMLRQAMSGDLPEGEAFDVEFMHEVLDLCVGCKGCSHDCPSEVDMAKLKAEVTHEYHERHGSGLRDRLFANVDTFAALGSATAPLSNWLTSIPGSRRLMEATVGISRTRDLPTFERDTLQDWWATRGPRVSETDAARKALLFPDTFTNYVNPAIGKDAVRVLEAAGVHIDLAERTDSGRPAHSKGFLDQSRTTAAANVEALDPRIADGWDVVLVEPSDAVMFQSDYCDLLGGAADSLASNAYGVCEYLDMFQLDDAIDWTSPTSSEQLVYHGHCHQKSTKKDHHAVGVLRRAGYDVSPLDSGCCGMAGTFGYEAEHDSLSRAIGGILSDQVAEAPDGMVVAPGESCRSQLEDVAGEVEPPHPVEALAAVLD
ncbi:FAD-binding protein [Halorarum halophilum]|uniref:D-lactate dehydrogenase (cytochrome) n=1 Tax=Halorarum halophilum TaxID=2743090 RepID=A0A7D5K9C6_9EURY|nr:FAD-binding and (Fe-S)-binding domain-containing protein [Halobaculum halophilum]QLG28954.1 FAD-binding protein [Halobaculum halophilum]